MAHLLNLQTFVDDRGNLTVIEKILPFDIKRVYYIYSVDKSLRGGHRHQRTIQAAICISGHCVISSHDGEKEEDFLLDHPEKCLILGTRDWHTMHTFSEDAILLVLASEYFDRDDYIFTKY